MCLAHMTTRERPSRDWGMSLTGTACLVLLSSAVTGSLLAEDIDPVQVGRFVTAGPARAVAVAGNYAYVGEGTNGLEVVDISNPKLPRLTGACGTAGSVAGVALAGSFAYLASEAVGLEVIDVSDPAHPQPVGSCDTDGTASGVTLAGHYAYVADGTNGLVVIDVSNPAQPRWVSGLDTSGYATGVKVVGGYAYVADGVGGLAIIDVNDPTKPRQVGEFPTSGVTSGVDVAGHYAYLADSSASSYLTVVDVSNPTQPQSMSSHADGPGPATGVVVAGGLAYLSISLHSVMLEVADIADPAKPRAIGYCYCPAPAWVDDFGLAVSGTCAFMAAGTQGLVVIDVGQVAVPQRIGGYPFWPYGGFDVLAVSGGLAYLATMGSLTVVDAGNPADPQWLGGCTTGVNLYPEDLAVRGNLAYSVATEMGGGPWMGWLQVLDVNDPARPQPVCNWRVGHMAYGIAVASHYAYIAAGDGLLVVDVGDPALPQEVGWCTTTGHTSGVALSGNYAYLSGFVDLSDSLFGWLDVVDVSDPISPRRVGTCLTGGQGYPYDLVTKGSYVYGAKLNAVWGGAGGLEIIDVSDPTKPKPVGRYETATEVYGAVVIGNYACITTLALGVLVLDVSDPTQPRRVSGNAVDYEGRAVVASDGMLYAAVAGPTLSGLRILELQPFFTSVTNQDGELHLAWESWGPGLLQKTSQLGAPDWQHVGGSESTNQLTLPTLDAGAEFFRVVRAKP